MKEKIFIFGLFLFVLMTTIVNKMIPTPISLIYISIFFTIIGILIMYYYSGKLMRLMIKIISLIFIIYSTFSLIEKGMDKSNAAMLAMLIWLPIYITSLLFEKRDEIRENKKWLESNWYLTDSPVHILKNKNMILRRNKNFIKNNFIEVIFVDKNFNKIEGNYDRMDIFGRDIRRVIKNSKVGFIDNTTKEIIIEPQFDSASNFWGKKEPVSSVMKDGKVYLINIRGKTIPHYDYA